MRKEPQKSSELAGRLRNLKTLLGLDRAIAYTVLARICGIVGSIGTILLIARFMSRIEQGYYYVLLSMISLRLIFELGATMAVIQMAAHECVHLTFSPDGSVSGDSTAIDRLASLFQKTLRWFSTTSLLMAVTLLPAGFYFLSIRSTHGEDIHWQWPWLFAVLTTALLLSLDSAIFFLEGCGQVRQVARARMGQAIAGALLAWSLLALRHGLFAPAGVSFSYDLVGTVFLFRRRHLFGILLSRAKTCPAISWRAEVWPFQWRLGVSSLCGYFTLQVFAPIAFATRGPIEAGQIGMSVSIVGYLGVIALAWMSTKAPAFGNLVAGQDYSGLDRLFFGTLRRSLPLLAAMAAACEGTISVLNRLLPHLASRMVSPAALALLLVALLGSHVMQSEGLYLRAFKREPFHVQSIMVSGLTLGLCFLLTPAWGSMGMALSYLVGVGGAGSLSATAIFHLWRRSLSRANHSPHLGYNPPRAV